MTKEEELIGAIAKIFKKDASEISAQTRYKEDLNPKSGDYFAIIAAYEDVCGASLSFGQIRKHKTVGDTIQKMNEALSK